MLHTFKLFPNLLFRIEPLLLKQKKERKAINGNIVNLKLMCKISLFLKSTAKQEHFNQNKYCIEPTKLSGESATYCRPKKCFSSKSRCLKTACNNTSPLECFYKET